MIQDRSLVVIADNSGAKIGRVFKVLGSAAKRYAEIGELVTLSVQVAEPRKGVKKKDILRGVVVRQRKAFRRKDGSYIKKGDTVVVLAGVDRGKSGKVTQVFPKTNMVLVEGTGMRKKHAKPRREGQKGQIIDKQFPIHASNVSLKK
ncbi:MAG: large subunit ribosomal protein L14 [Parcubacteria group bacterium Gr01-1014_56]|nr:MAG: large subunit ribosomal protein L14 [Parcubacteria group bacterium Gr01-1014_56]